MVSVLVCSPLAQTAFSKLESTHHRTRDRDCCERRERCRPCSRDRDRDHDRDRPDCCERRDRCLPRPGDRDLIVAPAEVPWFVRFGLLFFAARATATCLFDAWASLIAARPRPPTNPAVSRFAFQERNERWLAVFVGRDVRLGCFLAPSHKPLSPSNSNPLHRTYPPCNSNAANSGTPHAAYPALTPSATSAHVAAQL